ncbi:IS66 family transposase [Nostoc sp.]|uniref:IS66 family transposase n=1 Tax=Nostoc sp. TaxID=1180 RepID=UPI002FF999CE
MNQNLPQDLDQESLNQLSKEELVDIIIEQSKIIGELQKTIKELQQEIERLKVSRDLDSTNSSKPPSQLLRSLRDKAHQWWYFLDHPEIPPDNNQDERSLRLAVTKRKVSGGSRSMERFQHTANLLTVVQTCRRQGRSVIDFFAQALIADSSNSLSRPSLLPQY